MSISVNGQSLVPPGFRFHPTEEELLTYYLKKKVASERIDLDVIRDVDLNKLEPWDIQERCRIGSGPRTTGTSSVTKTKVPDGTRTNRATAIGFWKATGRDKAIYTSFKRIGMRKTLVFYQGRAHGQKSDWIMHEYRLDAADASSHPYYSSSCSSPMRGAAGDQAAQEEGWVVCRVFKKKNIAHHGQSSAAAAAASTLTSHLASKLAAAMGSSPSNCSSVTVSDHVKAQMLHSASDDALDQILQCMGRSCKQDTKPAALDHLTAATAACPNSLYGKFMKLPPLEHVSGGGLLQNPAEYAAADGLGIADWETLDRLAAYELNGLSDASRNMASFFDEPNATFSAHGAGGAGAAGYGDLWSQTRSMSSLHANLTMNNI